MKILKLTFVLFALFSQVTKAHDTLYLKNNSRISAKIIEVNPSEIKYSRSDNLNGPTYVLYKSDINYIKYYNGKIDSIKMEKVITVNVVPENDMVVNHKSGLETIKDKAFYNGKYISDRRLKFLFNECADPETRTKLLAGLKTARIYNTHRHLYAPIGLGVGFATVLATSPLVTQSEHLNLNWSKQTIGIAVSGIICGAIIRVSGCVMSKIYFNKRKHKMEELANLYNSIH